MAVAVSFFASPVLGATDQASTSTDNASPTAVGELVVVAQKREEKIETVPVAVTAFSSKERDVIGIRTTQDLSDLTPGLSYFSNSDRAYVRGIGRNTVSLAVASGVATYYNGVYYGANASIALSHDSLFVGNIEVDRGPQNELHGSNSDGGTINYVSQKPTDSFYAEGRVGVGDYGLYYGEAVVSGPISDKWKFRLGGSYGSENGGYFNNLDGPPQGGQGPQGNNGTWHYEEAQIQGSVGDHLDIWAMASSAEYDTSFHTEETVGNIPDFAFPDASLSPSGYFGFCAFAGAPASQCGGAALASNGFQTVVPGSAQGLPVLANQFPGNNPGNVNPRDFIQSFSGQNDQNDDIALATNWTYHFDNMDLQYIGGFQSFFYHLLTENTPEDSGLTSYQVYGNTGLVPGLGAANACAYLLASPGSAACQVAVSAPLTIDPSGLHTIFVEQDQYFSHELTLASTDKTPFQWIGGLYWYHEHFNQPVYLGCLPNQAQIAHPLLTSGAPAPANPDGCLLSLDGNLQYDDIAGFAHGSYKFNDQWQIQGGVRYTDDHKYGFEQQRLIEFDDPLVPALTAFTAPVLGSLTPALDLTSAPAAGAPGTKGTPFVSAATGFAYRQLDDSWGAWTGDATVNWTPDHTTLAYFRYARGYKAGGFNAGSMSAFPATQAEYVDSFELGAKKTVGSWLQVNAAAFYYNFQNDQQPFTVNLAEGGTTSQIVNIPQARIDGFEFEGVIRPIEPITMNIQYSYLDAVVTNMKGACETDTTDPFATQPNANTSGCTGGQQNLVGATLPESPKNKFSFNGQYAFHFGAGTLIFSGTYIWKDKTYGSIFNEPDSLSPSYSTVNLRATWEDVKHRYTVIGYVDNVFNTLGYDVTTAANLGPTPTSAAGGVPYMVSTRGLVAPLTFGAEFQFRFQ